MAKRKCESKPAQEEVVTPSSSPEMPALTGNLSQDIYNKLVVEIGKEKADKIMRDIAEFKMRTTVISTKKH